jgi:hypothetical protein
VSKNNVKIGTKGKSRQRQIKNSRHKKKDERRYGTDLYKNEKNTEK